MKQAVCFERQDAMDWTQMVGSTLLCLAHGQHLQIRCPKPQTLEIFPCTPSIKPQKNELTSATKIHEDLM